MKLASAAPLLLGSALGSCGRGESGPEVPVFAGEVTARQWLGDEGCEIEASFTGVPYEGDCDGCTYVFSVEVPTPDRRCTPYLFSAMDGTASAQTFAIEFDPEDFFWWDADWYYLARVEEVVNLLDDGESWAEGGSDLTVFSYHSNALEPGSVAFDGATLEMREGWETTDHADVTDHLWETCDAAAAMSYEGVAGVPSGALAVSAPPARFLREWRYTFAVVAPAEVQAGAVQRRSERGDEEIAVYLVDPDGCLVADGWSSHDCPSDDDVCAGTTISVDRPGLWSVVVGIGGSVSGEEVAFDTWVALDGEPAPLLLEEAAHRVTNREAVSSGESLVIRAQVNLPNGGVADVPGCDLAEVASGMAGADAVDCGVVPPWGDRSEVDACTVRAHRHGDPFVAVYEYEGMAEGATSAIVETASGAWLMTTRRGGDDGPVGIQQTYCPTPLVWPGGAGNDVVGCQFVGDGACTCFDATCSGEACCSQSDWWGRWSPYDPIPVEIHPGTIARPISPG